MTSPSLVIGYPAIYPTNPDVDFSYPSEYLIQNWIFGQGPSLVILSNKGNFILFFSTEISQSYVLYIVYLCENVRNAYILLPKTVQFR